MANAQAGSFAWTQPGLRNGLQGSGPPRSWQAVFDPRLTAELPTSTSADVRVAAERARIAQATWAERPIGDRAKLLLDFHDAVLDHREEFCDLLQYEGGKARLTAFEEVIHLALSARYYGRIAAKTLRPRRAGGLYPILTRVDLAYRPLGVVGIISPWNYPLSPTIADGLAALVAGNSVLHKPDLQTPFVALAAVDLLRQLGLPADVWQFVYGCGTEVGSDLIGQVDYLCFTGSTATGRLVAGQCAARLIGCSLELGGKNPLLVLADADVDQAAAGAVRACFGNAGQLCVATERIFVARPLMAAFTEAFLAQTTSLRLGYSLDYSADTGSLANRAQVERAAAHVADARRKGAVVLTGGRARPDLGPMFYEPTVLTGVTPNMDCYAEETFGPVASIYPVADESEAIRLANDSPYGLNASVWTCNAAHGRRVAAQLQCGTVNVNEAYGATFGSLAAPMGGMKASGLGRRQGTEGLLRFVESQSIGTQSLLPIAPRVGRPPQSMVNGLTAAMRVMKAVRRA